MRKLAWFVIILFAIILSIAIGCAANDTFKASVVGLLIGIFGPIWTGLSTGWSDFATLIGKSGTYFLIYTIGMLIFGGALFVGLTRLRRSGRLPSIRKPSLSPGSLAHNVQREPSEPEPAPLKLTQPEQEETETAKTAAE